MENQGVILLNYLLPTHLNNDIVRGIIVVLRCV